MHLRRFVLLHLACVSLLGAQTPSEPNEGLRLSADASTGALELAWWGRAGRVYFIEHSTDLFVWKPMPAFEAGADNRIAYGLVHTGTRLFARVRWVPATLAQFQVQDYDGDGITNADEAAAGLNPFAKDSDEDGMPDHYELAFGLDPALSDGDADQDGDGVPNKEDARPAAAGVGRLSITVAHPLPGSTL